MSNFPAPPTYAAPMIEAPDGRGEAIFNPIWLDWFLSVTQFINNTSNGVVAGTFTDLAVSGSVTGTGFTDLFASPPTIGGTSPQSGAFTSLSATSLTVSGMSSWSVTTLGVSGTSTLGVVNAGTTSVTGFTATGSSSVQALTGTTIRASGAFGCNGATVQTAYASGGSVATTGAALTSYGYTTAAQANGIVTLLNNIRAALVANGIMS